MLLKAITSLASMATGRRLTVLTFHNIKPAGQPCGLDEVEARVFEDRLGWLGEVATVEPLDVALAAVKFGRGVAHHAAITFDDGHVSNLTIALPVLQKLGVHATFFVLPALLGKSIWTEDVREAWRLSPATSLDLTDIGFRLLQATEPAERNRGADDLVEWLKSLPDAQRVECVAEIFGRCHFLPRPGRLMDEAQVRQLAAAGMGIGSHSLSHPILSRTTDAQAKTEIVQSRQRIADIAGRPAKFFAYPNGRPGIDYTTREVELVRQAGYTAAFTTGWGSAAFESKDFELPRFTPWDHSAFRFKSRLLSNICKRPKP
jgi:peptidoglycan/xylan/chitin deacetylase (PgdA/CDA1 family)